MMSTLGNWERLYNTWNIIFLLKYSRIFYKTKGFFYSSSATPRFEGNRKNESWKSYWYIHKFSFLNVMLRLFFEEIASSWWILWEYEFVSIIIDNETTSSNKWTTESCTYLLLKVLRSMITKLFFSNFTYLGAVLKYYEFLFAQFLILFCC